MSSEIIEVNYIYNARDIALGNNLDLKQVYKDQGPDFVIQDMELRFASRFVSDIRN